MLLVNYDIKINIFLFKKVITGKHRIILLKEICKYVCQIPNIFDIIIIIFC